MSHSRKSCQTSGILCPPLKKERTRSDMESVCHQMANILYFWVTSIPHSVTFLVLDLDFHTKCPDGVGDVVNILLFPELSP